MLSYAHTLSHSLTHTQLWFRYEPGCSVPELGGTIGLEFVFDDGGVLCVCVCVCAGE